MSIAGDVVAFSTGTGVATTTINVTLPNLGAIAMPPKVVWIYLLSRTDVVNAAGAGDINLSYGFATSPTSRRVVCSHSDSGVTPSSCDSQFRNDAVAMMLSPTTGADVGRVDINDMSTAGALQLIIDNPFGSSWSGFVVALGGTDVANASIVDFTRRSGSTGSDNVTVGFVPSYVEALSDWNAAGAFQFARTALIGTVGRCQTSNFTNQHLGWISLDAVATIDSASSSNDVEMLVQQGTPPSLIYRSSITALTADGFTVTTTEADSGGARPISALCLAGTFQLSMGNVISKTDLVTQMNAAMSFSPVVTQVWSACKTESVSDVDDPVTEVSIGAFEGIGNGNQGCIGVIDPETNPSSGATAIQFNQCYVNLDSTGAIEGSAKVDSTGTPATGFNLLMTDADPSGNFITYVSFGPAVPVVPMDAMMMSVGRSFRGHALAREF